MFLSLARLSRYCGAPLDPAMRDSGSLELAELAERNLCSFVYEA